MAVPETFSLGLSPIDFKFRLINKSSLKKRLNVNNQVEICCDVDHTQHADFEASTGRWDKAGLFLSGLCAIHCLLTPFLLLALPFLGEFLEHSWVHVTMALCVLPVGVYAFWSGFRHHKKKNVFAMGVLGLIFIGGGALLPHEVVEFYEYDLVTITGSFVLMTAHILNRRACQCHEH